MIEGTTQTRIDIMNLPEHSKKSCTGKNRRKVLQNFQKNLQNFRNYYFRKTQRLIKCISAIEGFVTSCRQLIENGPSASTLIEDAHAAAVQLSETIQSLGSGKSKNF